LEVLSLSSNGVGDAGAKALAAGLRNNRALRRLDLYFNLVSDAGVQALADALTVNRALRILHIDTNSVGEAGGLALARALMPPERGLLSGLMGGPPPPSPPALAELTMMYNHLTDAAAKALVATARANKMMHKFDITHNHGLHPDSKMLVEEMMDELKPRNDLAAWLVHHGLVPGGWHTVSGPPLASPFAQPVSALRAHTKEGLLALRHEDVPSIASRPELRSLQEDERTKLAALLIDLVSKATAHDEL